VEAWSRSQRLQCVHPCQRRCWRRFGSYALAHGMGGGAWWHMMIVMRGLSVTDLIAPL
jgi:hypothetical protein